MPRAVAPASIPIIVALATLLGTQDRGRWPGMLDEHPAIGYATQTTTDLVAELNGALAAGARTLDRDPRLGYLRAVLEALDIPVESQLLVFSQTGVQRAYTSPRNPRALYFTSSVVVGYIAGAPALEVAAQDARQGIVFYTLSQAGDTPRFVRQTGCLTCHVSASTLDVPGVLARSHVVDGDGNLMPNTTGIDVDHRTPHPDRWGGWFVTTVDDEARYSQRAHAGNLTYLAPGISSTEAFVAWANAAPAAHGYPAATSDIVSLLVFDHQAHAMNLLTRLGWVARAAEYGHEALMANADVRAAVDQLAAYFVFDGEAPPLAQLTPQAAFARHLAAAVPHDRRGRSLAELDASSRLFRYPCSYMVYSQAFDALPADIRRAVYARMLERLASTPAGRGAIEILRQTKHDFEAE